jgi:hypothetical protein
VCRSAAVPILWWCVATVVRWFVRFVRGIERFVGWLLRWIQQLLWWLEWLFRRCQRRGFRWFPRQCWR